MKRCTALALALLCPVGLVAQQPAAVRVQGTVYDSLSRTPVAHALVQFAPASGDGSIVSDSTGADGRFTLMLLPGEWIAGFSHPRLDSLMIDVPARPVKVAADRNARVVLAIPSLGTLVRALCGAVQDDSSGVLQGYVLRAPALGTLDSGGVYVQWSEMQISQDGLERAMPTLRARISPDGSYRACGIPVNTQTVVWVQRGRASTGLVSAEVPKSGIARLDLMLDTAATRDIAVRQDSGAVEDSTLWLPGELLRPLPRVGSARFSGVVRDASGKVVGNARARVVGLQPVKANEAGQFVLDSLAQGTQTLEVRALGFVPESRIVNVAAGAPADTIRLTSLKAMLDTVRVTTERIYNADVNGFEQRRLLGMGNYVGRKEIDAKHPYELTNLLYGVPGLQVSFLRGRATLRVHGVYGMCTPAIFLDGNEQLLDYESDINFLVQPDEIEGVEIYTKAPFTPPQFAGLGGTGCGSIVIWTRGRPKTRGLLRETPP